MTVVAGCILAVVAAFAGGSFGSATQPLHATAPKLIAHDTTKSTFTRRPAKSPAGPKVYMDSFGPSDTVVPSSAMGISQFLVAGNGAYNVFGRAPFDQLLGQVSNEAFWGGMSGPDAAGLCATSPQSDPSVAYDWAADRWVVSEAAYAQTGGASASGPFVECVAVSTSPDALGTWNRYVFQVSTTLYPSHPTLGVWGDGYYLSFNETDASGDWLGAGALALERSKMLTGAAAQARYFDLENVTPGLGGMLPASVNGYNQPTSGAPELYVQAHDDPLNINDRFEIWGFHVDWSAPITGSTFTPLANVPLNGSVSTAFSCADPNNVGAAWSNCIAQKGTPGTTELNPYAQANATSSDDLPQLGGRLEYSTSGGDEELSATMTVDAGSNLATPLWFELANHNGGGWGISTDGVFEPADSLNQPDTINRWLPSAAVDTSGDIGLAYAESNGSMFPSTGYTIATDGSSGDHVLDAGTTPFTTGPAYGQETTLSLDPVNLCTFWFTGPIPDRDTEGVEYYVLDTFSSPSCVASPTQAPLETALPSWSAPLVREGQTITGGDATFAGRTSTSYQWRRCDVNGWNCVDIPGATTITYVPTATDAAGTHTLRFEETAQNANGSSYAVSRATTLVQSIPPVNTVRPIISGNATDGALLSTDNGTWTSSSPLSYTYRWRRCSSGTCANIAGATASTYTLTSSDVGDTVDVVVSATNTGGGTDANAVATSTVLAGSGGSGGSGGGGSGGGARAAVARAAVARAAAVVAVVAASRTSRCPSRRARRRRRSAAP